MSTVQTFWSHSPNKCSYSIVYFKTTATLYWQLLAIIQTPAAYKGYVGSSLGGYYRLYIKSFDQTSCGRSSAPIGWFSEFTHCGSFRGAPPKTLCFYYMSRYSFEYHRIVYTSSYIVHKLKTARLQGSVHRRRPLGEALRLGFHAITDAVAHCGGAHAARMQ